MSLGFAFYLLVCGLENSDSCTKTLVYRTINYLSFPFCELLCGWKVVDPSMKKTGAFFQVCFKGCSFV